jgi:hypothetical protein
MRALGMRLVCAGLGLGVASCAALWGFDDATLRADAAAYDASLLDAGSSERSPASDAAADTSIDPPDAARETSTVGPDAAPAICAPACGVGAMCARAVGGASVCVDPSRVCTDGTTCGPPGCCVWLVVDSGTGRCEGPGLAGPGASPACLCIGPEHGKPSPSCKTCGPPPAMPGASVSVCGGS